MFQAYKERHPSLIHDLTNKNMPGHQKSSTIPLNIKDNPNSFKHYLTPSCLFHIPVQHVPPSPSSSVLNLNNSSISTINYRIITITWCVYGLSNGSIFDFKENSAPNFDIAYRTNINPIGCSMLEQHETRIISNSISSLF